MHHCDNKRRNQPSNQPSQAQPTPFRQVYDFEMQLSPQALPLRHVLQHDALKTVLPWRMCMRSVKVNGTGIAPDANPIFATPREIVSAIIRSI